MPVPKEKSETMYTGTLIENLIAAVERAEAQAGDVEMHKVRTETGVEDNDTEVVPAGSLNADYDLTDSAGRTATASSSDLMSPLGTLDDAVSLVAAEDFPLANAHMWAVPSAATGQSGHRGPLA
jgi:hypothetical protein